MAEVAITCPVAECRRKEILEKRQELGRGRKRPGSNFIVTHHECGLHKFHIEYGGDWILCPSDCPHN